MRRHGELCADGARAELLLHRGAQLGISSVKKRHTKHKKVGYDIFAAYNDKLWRSLHEGSRASRNFYRRYFREDSDVSSCTSLSSSEAVSR